MVPILTGLSECLFCVTLSTAALEIALLAQAHGTKVMGVKLKGKRQPFTPPLSQSRQWGGCFEVLGADGASEILTSLGDYGEEVLVHHMSLNGV